MLRRNILRRGTAIDKYTSIGADGFRLLMSRYYTQHFSFDELDLPHDLASRGVHDPELLPHYLYRDDGLRSWRATASYCRDMLKLFYTDDDDVITDTELQVTCTATTGNLIYLYDVHLQGVLKATVTRRRCPKQNRCLQ